MLLVGCSYLSGCQSQAQTLYEVEAGIKEKDVIISSEGITNLHVFNAFYDAVMRKQTSHVVLVTEHGHQYEKEVLAFSDDCIKRYSNIDETNTGYQSYDMVMYDEIKQIFKDDTVSYLLISDDREEEIISYTLEN